MSDFFEYVRDAARAAGYDIDSPRGGGKKELAEAVGMSQSSVSRMISGTTVPEAAALGRLADVLGVPRNDLLNLAGIPTDEGADGSLEVLPLSAELFGKLRTLRKIHGVSARELADRMTAQGFQIKRSVIANCESGRVRSLSVDYADHAARALGITLVQLITEPAVCPKCGGEPPAGFTCNTCGAGDQS